jgi:hypothetical protein
MALGFGCAASIRACASQSAMTCTGSAGKGSGSISEYLGFMARYYLAVALRGQ